MAYLHYEDRLIYDVIYDVIHDVATCFPAGQAPLHHTVTSSKRPVAAVRSCSVGASPCCAAANTIDDEGAGTQRGRVYKGFGMALDFLKSESRRWGYCGGGFAMPTGMRQGVAWVTTGIYGVS